MSISELSKDGTDEKTLEWWRALEDTERRLATTEAAQYESLSEEERDGIWNQGPDSIEAKAETDEIKLPM
jgi:hypothetical protein